MVLAMLDGRKTQTRRLLNPQPGTFLVDGRECEVVALHVDGEAVPRVATGRVLTAQKLRYAVGDRLYVRESGIYYPGVPGGAGELFRHDVPIAADHGVYWSRNNGGPGASYMLPACTRSSALASPLAKVRPSIHMPRWASRLTLIVEDVRVERLQAISKEDAIAEGVTLQHAASSPVIGYQTIWNLLHNNAGDRWDDNPFVVVVSFRVVRGNIDQVPA